MRKHKLGQGSFFFFFVLLKSRIRLVPPAVPQIMAGPVFLISGQKNQKEEASQKGNIRDLAL